MTAPDKGFCLCHEALLLQRAEDLSTFPRNDDIVAKFKSGPLLAMNSEIYMERLQQRLAVKKNREARAYQEQKRIEMMRDMGMEVRKESKLKNKDAQKFYSRPSGHNRLKSSQFQDAAKKVMLANLMSSFSRGAASFDDDDDGGRREDRSLPGSVNDDDRHMYPEEELARTLTKVNKSIAASARNTQKSIPSSTRTKATSGNAQRSKATIGSDSESDKGSKSGSDDDSDADPPIAPPPKKGGFFSKMFGKTKKLQAVEAAKKGDKSKGKSKSKASGSGSDSDSDSSKSTKDSYTRFGPSKSGSRATSKAASKAATSRSKALPEPAADSKTATRKSKALVKPDSKVATSKSKGLVKPAEEPMPSNRSKDKGATAKSKTLSKSSSAPTLKGSTAELKSSQRVTTAHKKNVKALGTRPVCFVCFVFLFIFYYCNFFTLFTLRQEIEREITGW